MAPVIVIHLEIFFLNKIQFFPPKIIDIKQALTIKSDIKYFLARSRQFLTWRERQLLKPTKKKKKKIKN